MNKKIRCLAIDDENHALEVLKMYIEKTPFLSLDGMLNDPWEGLQFIKEKEIDLIFLDIQMEGINGIQFMEILDKKIPIILTTAYSEYALKGYEFQVKDYLLKPFSYHRFIKAVTLVWNEFIPGSTVNNSEQQDKPADEVLLIKSDAKHKYYRIRKSEVMYIESMRNYVRYYLKDKNIISLQSLTKTEKTMGDKFLRIHKSYIVNLDAIEMIDGNQVVIGQIKLPIGSNYRKFLYDSLDKNADID